MGKSLMSVLAVSTSLAVGEGSITAACLRRALAHLALRIRAGFLSRTAPGRTRRRHNPSSGDGA